MSGRLYYVDWLRVFAFGILLVYHSSVTFFPDMGWLIESAEKSAALSMIMDFPRAWRLAVLFFVSGMGTWFAFKSATGRVFLQQRTARLLIPLLFAMCVILVPQVWYERRFEDGYTGSLLEFWVFRYFTEGKYPSGNFTWAHMWFVAYLLVMSLLTYPFFRLLVEPRMRWLTDWFERTTNSIWVYLFFLLPLALNLALTPIFPRQTNTLINDGAWFATWTCWFGFGFLVARHHKAVIQSIVERRWLSAALAACLTVLMYRYSWDGSRAIGDYENQTALFKAGLFSLAWAMILTVVGFGALHLNRPNETLVTLNRRIFPLYIFHQTVLVAALFYILPLHLNLWVKYATVLAITVGVSALLATLADRLPWPLRALFGLADDAAKVTAKSGEADVRTR